MNLKLASLCARLWLLGFAGMWASKGLFDAGVGTVGFDLAFLVCAAGGATYVLLGALVVLGAEEPERVRAGEKSREVRAAPLEAP